MKHSKTLKKVFKQMVMGLVVCAMIIPGVTGFASENTTTGEIRWDFIEGKEAATAYKEGGDTVTVSQSNGALVVNAESVTDKKVAGFALNNAFTIKGDVHKYIVVKADLPEKISKISAYLYNTTTQTSYLYGWANNDNSIQAGIATGEKTYALKLNEGHTKSGGADTQVADGVYDKLEIRFSFSEGVAEKVISIDYVAITGYNKDAVMCNGANTNSSITGADAKPILISGLNVGSENYALNETSNGYTVCGIGNGYENLETATITATAADGWTVSNTATTVTALENHKIVDAVVTATDGNEIKASSYRFVFYFEEVIPAVTTGEIRWDFIEGKEAATAYKEGGDTVTVSQSNGALVVNAESVTDKKVAGFALNNAFTIKGDVHKYIVVKADLPEKISKISAYLYNTTTQTSYLYGWANNDNSIQAGIATGEKTYALKLNEGHTKSGGADTQVADGVYDKLEIRFSFSEGVAEKVISIDYVAITGYNKDAVMCNGANTNSSITGADAKPILISGLNVGSENYALNETSNGYTVCGIGNGYENLETATITATAADGWTVSNTATTVTALENHKIVDAVVTATDGNEIKASSYRFVFYREETGESVWMLDNTEIHTLADLTSATENSKLVVLRTVVIGSENAPASIIPIIAHYGEDKVLKDTALGEQYTGLIGEPEVLTVTLDDFSYEDGDYLKVFYWSKLSELVPILDVQDLD